MENTVTKIGLCVVKDGKILMVRTKNNKEIFYMIGGKPDQGESDIECVKRETLEEVGIEVDAATLKYLGEWEDATKPDSRWDRVTVRLFIGELVGKPKPSSEVVELRWMDSTIEDKHLTPISINHLFPFLKKEGYIN
jgi:8-oxo-dGTP diphosphatase